jgi:hypothetical protein
MLGDFRSDKTPGIWVADALILISDLHPTSQNSATDYSNRTASGDLSMERIAGELHEILRQQVCAALTCVSIYLYGHVNVVIEGTEAILVHAKEACQRES